MSKREEILKVFKGEEASFVPVGFWFHFLTNDLMAAGMEHPELIEQNLDGHKKFKEEFQPDFVKLMSDGLFYRPDNTYPTINCAHDLINIKPLDENHPWINACVEHAKKVREIMGDDILIYYNVTSPFHHILKHINGTSGMKEFPKFIKEDKEAFLSAQNALLSDTLNLVKRVLLESKMDGIYFNLHNDNVFTNEEYNELIKPTELEVLQLANSICPINIAHVCGYRGRVNNFEVYKDYPATVFNWSLHTTDLTIAEGKKYFNHCKCVIGGFDQTPGSLIHAGTEEEIKSFVKKLLDENGTEGFIIGADCTIPSDTPIQHLLWAKEASHNYKK